MGNSVNYWRILFFIMVGIACIFLFNPRVVVKRENIYIIVDHTSDEPPLESRFM
jgi:hypothetical protein